jgi:hypothetical protein
VEGGLKFAGPVALLRVEVPSNEHWDVFQGDSRTFAWLEGFAVSSNSLSVERYGDDEGRQQGAG